MDVDGDVVGGPISRDRIEGFIQISMNRQDALTNQYRADAENAAKAEAEFKSAFAQARLRARAGGNYAGAKVTGDIADDLATEETAELLMEMLTTAAREAATRQALLSIRMKLDSLRSLMANYREIGA